MTLFLQPQTYMRPMKLKQLRGHSLKLFKPRCHKTVRQNFFSLRVVNEWNKLPQDVVDAPTINTFKNRLDRHWHDMGTLSWSATQPINLKYQVSSNYNHLPLTKYESKLSKTVT